MTNKEQPKKEFKGVLAPISSVIKEKMKEKKIKKDTDTKVPKKRKPIKSPQPLKPLKPIIPLSKKNKKDYTTQKTRNRRIMNKIDTEGLTSFYGEELRGELTASGEPFNPDKLTAALWEVPFNTRVKVTNKNNNKSVVVRINDRGPNREKYPDRIIDLSRAAFEKIEDTKKGLTDISLEILPKEDKFDHVVPALKNPFFLNIAKGYYQGKRRVGADRVLPALDILRNTLNPSQKEIWDRIMESE